MPFRFIQENSWFHFSVSEIASLPWRASSHCQHIPPLTCHLPIGERMRRASVFKAPWAEAERENSLGGNIMFAVNHLATFPKRKVSEQDCRSGWWVPLGSQSATNSPGEHSSKFVRGFQSRSSDIWEVRELPRINRTRFRKKLLIHPRQEGHCLKEPVSFSDVQTGG